MIRVSPSILAADFADLGRDIGRIKQAGAEYVHIDVMDGLFVPNITIGQPVVASIRKGTELPLDVHLMIDKPLRYIETFAQAGADLLSIHLEADHPTRIAEALKVMEACGVKKAVALRPITSARAILPYIQQLDMVLVMTVEPGFGGQSFMEDMMPKLAWLRQRCRPGTVLQVDGGINRKTIAAAAAAGADCFVAGSAVFGREDYGAEITALRELARAAV